MKTYRECLEYLERLELHGMKLGLNNIRRLLALLGNPERALVFYHVGGTNGKGSTAAFLQRLLLTTRRKVGLYTSPHLEDFRERIRVNRRMITRPEVVSGLNRLLPLIGEVARTPGCSHPTYFEVTTALACLHFQKLRADAVVWEVGLGGRLDATNAVTPRLTVITNVGLEHCRYLGTTLSAIAREKAGIVKPGVPLVTAESAPGVLRVFREVCRRRRSPLIRVFPRYSARVMAEDRHGQTVRVLSPRRDYGRIRLPGRGRHQVSNFLTALAAWEAGEERSPSVPLIRLRGSAGRFDWPGRFQVVEEPFPLILDGAHNPAAAASLAATLKSFLEKRPLRLILGVLSDKDVSSICRFLVPLAREVIVVAPRSDRALPSDRLASACRRLSLRSGTVVRDLKNIEAAFDYCYHENHVAEGGWTCVTGSLYLVGEARKLIRCWRKR